MQFVVIERTVEGTGIPPLEQVSMVRAGLEVIARGNPKIKAAYPFADINGGCLIVEVDSGDELNELLSTLPFSALSKYEVHPTATIEGMSRVLANAQQMMAQGR